MLHLPLGMLICDISVASSSRFCCYFCGDNSTVCLSLTRQMIYIFLHPVLGVTCLSRWNLSSARRKEHKHFEAGYSLSYSDLVWLFSKFDGFISHSGRSATVASFLRWFAFLFVAPVCLMWVTFQAPPSTVLFSFPSFGSWPGRAGSVMYTCP